ncbi:MAG: hypothetical protein ACI4BB_12685 [Coprococcus sp.]
MKNMTVVILENREIYGERLAAFISRHEDSPFNVQLYLEHPVPMEKWEKADVVLMTSSLSGIYEKDVCGRRLMILDEEGKGFENDNTVVYKYQSAVVIYTALLEFCMDKSGKRLLGNGRPGKEWMIMGIYTPIGGEKKTAAILSMCRKMAVDRRVLYLNLEQVPVFQELLEADDRQEGISDLIYYVKQRSRNLGVRLGRMVIKGEFDYLMPAVTSAEVGELNAEEWRFCLDSIRSETDYEKVIVDFGSAVPPVALLDICTRWLIIGEGTPWEQRLIRQFRRILNRMTDRTDTEIIDEIELEEAENRNKI